jgi:hypothetical protein
VLVAHRTTLFSVSPFTDDRNSTATQNTASSFFWFGGSAASKTTTPTISESERKLMQRIEELERENKALKDKLGGR